MSQFAKDYQAAAMAYVGDANRLYARFVMSRAKPMGTVVTDLLHGAVGASGETGELLDAVKKCWVYGKEVTPEVVKNLKEECGDALFYIQIVCNVVGCSMQDLINENIEKLCLRYPDGYSNEAALARADKSSGQ